MKFKTENIPKEDRTIIISSKEFKEIKQKCYTDGYEQAKKDLIQNIKYLEPFVTFTNTEQLKA